MRAEIQTARGGGAFVAVPAHVVAALGGGGRIPVEATFDGIAYTGSNVSMGGGPCVGMLKAVRERLGKGPGDTVAVTVRRDTVERTVEVPEDLAAALSAASARPAFDALSYSRCRRLVGAIESAERPETRAKRIDEAVAAAG
ncbi:YdeI/OmpD-associated family protein [Nocardia amikacinitolerans]|uniref:YdeI/OmpD-associated family protein n=1 Tax=Nocardia amikacinitolerans TaxID=756689 RepID=UPI00368AE6E8